MQGGRYEKNWPKHGPFNRPYSYGSIPNMDHEGYAARFAMTFAVYEDGKLPGYEGQLISGMAMTSRIQATRFVADGSTFRTVDTDALVTTADRSFRPVDTAVGPDGAVYFADWCDIRMDHTDPRDTWDKSCGRIWRLRANHYRPAAGVGASPPQDDERQRVVHVLDPEGEQLWNDDHPPSVPTSQWKPGQTVEYTRTIFIPNYPHIGEAAVRIGLYSQADGKRLVLSAPEASRANVTGARLAATISE